MMPSNAKMIMAEPCNMAASKPANMGAAETADVTAKAADVATTKATHGATAKAATHVAASEATAKATGVAATTKAAAVSPATTTAGLCARDSNAADKHCCCQNRDKSSSHDLSPSGWADTSATGPCQTVGASRWDERHVAMHWRWESSCSPLLNSLSIIRIEDPSGKPEMSVHKIHPRISRREGARCDLC
jgi:hypothetical protein